MQIKNEIAMYACGIEKALQKLRSLWKCPSQGGNIKTFCKTVSREREIQLTLP